MPTWITIKLVAWVVAGSLLFATLTGGFFYIKSLRSELEVSQTQIETLDGVIKDKDAEIDKKNRDLSRQRAIIGDLNNKWNEARNERDELVERYHVVTETLKKRAMTDPDGVQVIINQMAEESRRCSQIASGSKIQEADKKNTTCPSLVKGVK